MELISIKPHWNGLGVEGIIVETTEKHYFIYNEIETAIDDDTIIGVNMKIQEVGDYECS